MDNTVTQVRQRDLISQGEPGQHAIVNQRGVKAPNQIASMLPSGILEEARP